MCSVSTLPIHSLGISVYCDPEIAGDPTSNQRDKAPHPVGSKKQEAKSEITDRKTGKGRRGGVVGSNQERLAEMGTCKDLYFLEDPFWGKGILGRGNSRCEALRLLGEPGTLRAQSA